MKFSSAIIPVCVLAALLAACSSLDNPFGSLFHTGHDERVYNPQTGQYEWPAGKATPKPQKSAAVASALNSTPAPQTSDGRYFDPQKNEWVEVRKESPSAKPSSKPSATPAPGAGEGNPVAVSPEPMPAPPRPAQDTGVYNTSTGRIEWRSAGGPIPPSAPPGVPPPAPPGAKHWWWPFGSKSTASNSTPKPSPHPTKPTTSTAATTTAAAPVKHWWWPF